MRVSLGTTESDIYWQSTLLESTSVWQKSSVQWQPMQAFVEFVPTIYEPDQVSQSSTLLAATVPLELLTYILGV